ncbi:actin-like ATPase domain-containing protein [Massarina eburnea CBS 473.64]|uniref:Actin-like ATPase domain-containing protein n=1 Tax=Massarina eburnea CBS 473.64 TaxID=1395130 RepID=A0A6A6S8P8_9PLEO|nr:actin-like ATPase domain-containing protein [Massarina eburnea CBS 473.64]
MASEIVVGIDFGTTYSGVSWAVNGGTKTIRLINDWPNPNSTVANSDKVPTKLSYKDGKPHNWGYAVDYREESFRWIKLLLDPKNRIGRTAEAVLTSTKLLGAMNKSAEEVAADYLKMIWEYTKSDIQRVRGDSWASIYTLRCVLTVPAIWSQVAKEKTLKIARMADLPENLSMVTEPEAAALAVLKEKTSEEDGSLEIGDCFVVCDAGGGTVDLISYKICGLDPLQIEECAIGDGGLCGSVYLDQAFERYIKTIVGEEEYKAIKERDKKKMLQEFELSVKRTYSGDDKPYSVDLRGVQDNLDDGIDDDTITLKPSVLQTVFDHVIGQIMRLVEKQIDEAQERGNRVKAILLVGGFGTNRYMHRRLKEAYKRSQIQILQNNGAWSSICRGATMWGLENSPNSTYTKKTVKARLARYSYGLCYSVPFNESKGHLMQDRWRSPTGTWMARNQMGWLIQKGDRLEDGRVMTEQISTPVQVSMFSSGTRAFLQELYYCADDDPPPRREISVKEFCTVNYGIDCGKLWHEESFKDPTSGEKWRHAKFDLMIALDSATLHFVVIYRKKPVAYTKAKYKEEM